MKGIIQQSQLTKARGELAAQGDIFRAPLQTAIEVPGRIGPLSLLETDDRGTIVAPERVGLGPERGHNAAKPGSDRARLPAPRPRPACSLQATAAREVTAPDFEARRLVQAATRAALEPESGAFRSGPAWYAAAGTRSRRLEAAVSFSPGRACDGPAPVARCSRAGPRSSAVAQGLFHQPERKVVAIPLGQVPYLCSLPPVATTEDIVLFQCVSCRCHCLGGVFWVRNRDCRCLILECMGLDVVPVPG